MSSLGKLLGKPLAWAASLGTATLSGLAFYGLGLIGFAEGKVSPVVYGAIVAAVAKLVGWLVATYGPKPTNAPVPPAA